MTNNIKGIRAQLMGAIASQVNNEYEGDANNAAKLNGMGGSYILEQIISDPNHSDVTLEELFDIANELKITIELELLCSRKKP